MFLTHTINENILLINFLQKTPAPPVSNNDGFHEVSRNRGRGDHRGGRGGRGRGGFRGDGHRGRGRGAPRGAPRAPRGESS